MSGLAQRLAKGAVAAPDGRRPGRTDSSIGESFKGVSSRGESSRGESSRGESCKRESSKRESSKGEPLQGEPWLRLGKGKSVEHKFFSLYPMFSESESEAAFEMKPLTPQATDEEKTDGKGKKKVDKGKAVYKDPFVNQDVSGGEQRREVEPKKDEGDTTDLLGALANLRLDHDEYQEELAREQKLEQERKQELKLKLKLKQRPKQKQLKRRKAPSAPPYHETEDGWMMIKENVNVWDFSEETGPPLPD